MIDFCDNFTNSDSEFHHTTKSNSAQNYKCELKSTWEVITDHEDFANDNNIPQTIDDTTPIFSVIQQPDIPRIYVLVIDLSGAMMGSVTFFLYTIKPKGFQFSILHKYV